MDEQATMQALASLLDLSRRAREAGSQRELGFLLVNDSNSLLPYRQAALWLAPKTVYALSGLVQVEANAPYVQWLNRVCQHLDASSSGGTRAVSADQLPPELAAQWDEWWPAHALWLSWVDPDHGAGALLLLRDEAWPEQSQHLAQEWVRVWQHAFRALEGSGSGLARRLGRFFLGKGRRPGTRRPHSPACRRSRSAPPAPGRARSRHTGSNGRASAPAAHPAHGRGSPSRPCGPSSG